MGKKTEELFEILILGTMKSGKTTLLNAMMGFELLPMNTNSIFRLEQRKKTKSFRGHKVVGKKQPAWEKITQVTLYKWNKEPKRNSVQIQACFPGIQSAARKIVFYDTPASNDATNKQRGETALQELRERQYDLILYILATEQLCSCDESDLLKELKSISVNNNKLEIIFVLNKADIFDEDKKEEEMCQVISNQKSFLLKVGFKQAQIIPVMAKSAMLIRMREAYRRWNLTAREDSDLSVVKELLNDWRTPLLDDTDCSDEVRAGMKARSEAACIGKRHGSIYALLATGIPTLEACLNKRILSN